MATFNWHITEGIPVALESKLGGISGVYQATVEDFDIAIGALPFFLYAGDDQPYERITAQWRKDQFDTAQNVGEQSLTGWWLRSQSDFSGGDGVTYIEPLLGEGSETRFRDSRGVNPFTADGSVEMLMATAEEVDLGNSDVEAVAGATRVLIRDGGSVSVFDGSTNTAVTGTTTAVGLAETGSLFLVGDGTTIYDLPEDTGTTLTALWTNFTADVKPFWVKQRIIAASGPELFELTLAGGDASLETPLYTHPDDNWEWISVTETGGAIWAAGRSGDRSAVHVFTVDATGATPTLTAATVAIQLPTGEAANAMLGYLDFLLIGTSAGFRVAVVQDDRASLGPLLWRDEAVLSLTARGDFAWCGIANGLTRRVDLGNEVAGDLVFAWAHDLAAAGDILSLDFFGDRLILAGSAAGLYRESDTDLVATGYLTTGFTRFGTLENKHFRNALVNVEAINGSIAVSAGPEDPPLSLITLSALDGAKNISLNFPGRVGQRISMRFDFSRDASDPTLGPTLVSYQLRALPAPNRKQRLFQLPLMCIDNEKDRWGMPVGGKGFAFARLNALENLERTGEPVILQDFRTNENRNVVIEQVHFSGPESPDQSEVNFGGTISLRVRVID